MKFGYVFTSRTMQTLHYRPYSITSTSSQFTDFADVGSVGQDESEVEVNGNRFTKTNRF